MKRDAATGAQLWTHTYGDPCVGCFDVPSDVRVDPEGNVFVIGRTSSAPFSNDVILFVLDTATGVEKDRGVVFNTGAEIPTSGALRFDAAFNLFDGGQIYNANTGAVDMTVTKWASLIGGGRDSVRRCRVLPGALQADAQWPSAASSGHAGEHESLRRADQYFSGRCA